MEHCDLRDIEPEIYEYELAKEYLSLIRQCFQSGIAQSIIWLNNNCETGESEVYFRGNSMWPTLEEYLSHQKLLKEIAKGFRDEM